MTRTNKSRRMTRGPQADTITAKIPNKLDQVEAMLRANDGASIAELMAATGWQQHSVRGALGGAIRKRGLNVSSHKTGGVRRYRVAAAQ